MRGKSLKLSLAKYQRNKLEEDQQPQKKRTVLKKQEPKRSYSLRDSRSYKEVILRQDKVEVESSENVIQWLKYGLVCIASKRTTIHEANLKISRTGITNLVCSRLDSFSFLVHMNSEQVLEKIPDPVITELNTVFMSVKPWSMEFRPKFRYDYAITGVPIHLWKDDTFIDIGHTIGRVVDLEYQPNTYHVMKITIESSFVPNIQKRITLVEKQHEYEVIVTTIGDGDDMDENFDLYPKANTNPDSWPIPRVDSFHNQASNVPNVSGQAEETELANQSKDNDVVLIDNQELEEKIQENVDESIIDKHKRSNECQKYQNKFEPINDEWIDLDNRGMEVEDNPEDNGRAVISEPTENRAGGNIEPMGDPCPYSDVESTQGSGSDSDHSPIEVRDETPNSPNSVELAQEPCDEVNHNEDCIFYDDKIQFEDELEGSYDFDDDNSHMEDIEIIGNALSTDTIVPETQIVDFVEPVHIEKNVTQDDPKIVEAQNAMLDSILEDVVNQLMEKAAEAVTNEKEEATAACPSTVNTHILEASNSETVFMDLATARAQDSNQVPVSSENVSLDGVPTSQAQNIEKTPKKRGRPKKQFPPFELRDLVESSPFPCNKDEAIKTWEVGSTVGMSTRNKDGVLTILRRSQRQNTS